ncbi:GntR family transcriptional regulator [Leucobacter allii]|uniref:GntR family transcriptional regulator n=1 Tax=Leucobacter allii TaxID=2932247 RepID=A0ABY4FJQ4_9MICO|nr:GntR family transcriptional regulator [Leucobacter allii]UOQ56249.1 GntR family transcriptional regulator [Leucobacter allii]
MLIRIDEASERPIYAQIADAIRGDLAAGRLRAGETLPPAREVAAALRINPHTVLHAYQALRDEGLVDLRRGRGAVVTDRVAGLAELHVQAVALAERATILGIGPEALAALVSHAGRRAGAPVAARATRPATGIAPERPQEDR